MEKILITFTIMLLPFAFLEALLNIPSIYNRILLDNNGLPNIISSVDGDNNFPELLIVGSSLSRRAFDNRIIQKILHSKDINIRVENISVNASTTLNDYATLMRILRTCNRCPEAIIYSPTDIAFTSSAFIDWEAPTIDRLKSYYFNDESYTTLLLEAAKQNKNYKKIYSEIEANKLVKTFLLGPHIRSIISTMLFQMIYNENPARSRLLYAQYHNTPDIGYGYVLVDAKMTQELKEKQYLSLENRFFNYKIGGSGAYFFEKFLLLAKQKKIQVYIVLTPTYNGYSKKFHNQISMYKQYVTEQGYKSKSPIIDGSSFNNTHDHYFEDLFHLNSYGSQKFSVFVGNELAKIWRTPAR